MLKVALGIHKFIKLIGLSNTIWISFVFNRVKFQFNWYHFRLHHSSTHVDSTKISGSDSSPPMPLWPSQSPRVHCLCCFVPGTEKYPEEVGYSNSGNVMQNTSRHG